MSKNPFAKAGKAGKRLKLFLVGDSGVGKTTLALQFPAPCVIDLERGAELYGDSFSFDILPVTDAEAAMEAVEWLMNNKHDYKTLVIDPITVYWEALQKKWSDIFKMRNKGGKGFKFEFYDLQIRDWQTIKSEWKAFLRRVISLDMNIIVTAREKQERDKNMNVIGTTFDGEKGLPYAFDTVIHMYMDGDKRMGRTRKDRTNTMPEGDYEISYSLFDTLFGPSALSRPAETVHPTEDMLWTFDKLCAQLHLDDHAIEKALSRYGVKAAKDLSMTDMEGIIETLKAKAVEKTGREYTDEDF